MTITPTDHTCSSRKVGNCSSSDRKTPLRCSTPPRLRLGFGNCRSYASGLEFLGRRRRSSYRSAARAAALSKESVNLNRDWRSPAAGRQDMRLREPEIVEAIQEISEFFREVGRENQIACSRSSKWNFLRSAVGDLFDWHLQHIGKLRCQSQKRLSWTEDGRPSSLACSPDFVSCQSRQSHPGLSNVDIDLRAAAALSSAGAIGVGSRARVLSGAGGRVLGLWVSRPDGHLARDRVSE